MGGGDFIVRNKKNIVDCRLVSPISRKSGSKVREKTGIRHANAWRFRQKGIILHCDNITFIKK